MTLSICLAAFFSTKLSFHLLYSLQNHVHICHTRDYAEQRQLWWCKHNYQGYDKRESSMRKYLRGLGNLSPRAAYINFLTPSRVAYIQGQLTIE